MLVVFRHVCPPWFAPHSLVIDSSNIRAVVASDTEPQRFGRTVVRGDATANSGSKQWPKSVDTNYIRCNKRAQIPLGHVLTN